MLPKNHIKGKRKAGVRLELFVLRKEFPDHLSLFEGLWEYTSSLDNYHGTIFRFPLRNNRTTPSGIEVRGTNLNVETVRQLVIYRI